MADAVQSLEIHTRNAEFQLLEALARSRRQRAQQRRFLVEGVRSIDQLCAARARDASSWTVDAWVCAQGRAPSRWASEVLALPARRRLVLAEPLMAELSDKEETSELLAVVDLPRRGLDAIEVSDPALVVIADRPQSPGNLGTLVRSCDAFGARGVVVTGHAADPFDPRSVRAAAGSLFGVPVVGIDSTRALVAWIDRLRASQPGLSLVGTSANAERACSDYDWTAPTVVALGNERTGLSRGLRDACDALIAIPMRGTASSLNLASAASVLLYEAQRQRSHPGDTDPV